MNWQFWKKTPPIANIEDYTIPFSLNKKLDYSLSSWEEELSYSNIHYRVTLKNTTPKLSNYNTLLTTIHVDSSVKEDIRRIVDAQMKRIIMRDTIFENLYKTLNNLCEECKEEGFQQFSEIARENAKKILKAVYKNFPDHEYYIYPTEDREIAIDCNPQKGKGILILCDSNGSVAYFSTLAGKNSRFRCDNIEDFPYDLLWKTFKELNEEKKYSLNKDITRKTSSVFVSYRDIPLSKASNVIYDSPTGIKYQYA